MHNDQAENIRPECSPFERTSNPVTEEVVTPITVIAIHYWISGPIYLLLAFIGCTAE